MPTHRLIVRLFCAAIIFWARFASNKCIELALFHTWLSTPCLSLNAFALLIIWQCVGFTSSCNYLKRIKRIGEVLSLFAALQINIYSFDVILRMRTISRQLTTHFVQPIICKQHNGCANCTLRRFIIKSHQSWEKCPLKLVLARWGC